MILRGAGAARGSTSVTSSPDETGQDTYMINGNAAAIFDGVGGWKKYGVDAGQFARTFAANLFDKGDNNDDMLQQVEQSLQETQDHGTSTITYLRYSPSNRVLQVFTIGDSYFRVYRKGDILFDNVKYYTKIRKPSPCQIGNPLKNVSDAINTPLSNAEQYQIQLENGDLIIAATDGLWDNEPEDMGNIVEGFEDLTEACEFLVNEVKMISFLKQPEQDTDDDTIVVLGRIE